MDSGWWVCFYLGLCQPNPPLVCRFLAYSAVLPEKVCPITVLQGARLFDVASGEFVTKSLISFLPSGEERVIKNMVEHLKKMT